MKVYRHKIIARFGLMHMIGTNLSVWLNVLIQETKHEILTFFDPENRTLRISHRLGEFFYFFSIFYQLKLNCILIFRQQNCSRSCPDPSSRYPRYHYCSPSCSTWFERTSSHFRVPSYKHNWNIGARCLTISVSVHNWIFIDLCCNFICYVAWHLSATIWTERSTHGRSFPMQTFATSLFGGLCSST